MDAYARRNTQKGVIGIDVAQNAYALKAENMNLNALEGLKTKEEQGGREEGGS